MNETKLLKIKALAYAIDHYLMNANDDRKEELSNAIILSGMLIDLFENETENGEP